MNKEEVKDFWSLNPEEGDEVIRMGRAINAAIERVECIACLGGGCKKCDYDGFYCVAVEVTDE